MGQAFRNGNGHLYKIGPMSFFLPTVAGREAGRDSVILPGHYRTTASSWNIPVHTGTCSLHAKVQDKKHKY